MPIYEFYCSSCHVLFSFFSRRVDTESRPRCPRCRRRKLDRRVSGFAVTHGQSDDPAAAVPESSDLRLESAMDSLASEIGHIDENDPRQAAGLMRRFSEMTGMRFGEGMKEALSRLEMGEDPESIEAEMGETLESEDPYMENMGPGGSSGRARSDRSPERDPVLYDLQ